MGRRRSDRDVITGSFLICEYWGVWLGRMQRRAYSQIRRWGADTPDGGLVEGRKSNRTLTIFYRSVCSLS